MKFLTFIAGQTSAPGVLSADGTKVFPLSSFGYRQDTLQQFIIDSEDSDLEGIKAKLSAGSADGFALTEVKLIAAIPEPLQEVIIMENNFVKDDGEAAEFRKKRESDPLTLPTYFYKKASLCNNDGDEIPSYPGHADNLDYQAELCAVLKDDVYKASPADAGSHIFGYTVINNVIARNLTIKHRRPYIATSLDGFLPMCSFVVTADEFQAGHEFVIKSYVNGELRQHDTTAHLKFDAEYAIADLTQLSVLHAASILSVGTPFGSGKDQHPEQYLKSGDRVTCEVEGVGTVTNIIH